MDGEAVSLLLAQKPTHPSISPISLYHRQERDYEAVIGRDKGERGKPQIEKKWLSTNHLSPISFISLHYISLVSEIGRSVAEGKSG